MKKLLFALVAVMLFACLAVSVSAAEYVYYENDFSDAATLEDFTQYRGVWSIVDGQLRLTDYGEITIGDQAFLLFTKDESIMNLTDYILEVDMYNVQTQGGPLFRCDVTKATGETNNSFYGYQAFLSFTGTKGALGRGDLLGDWAGNLKVSGDVVTRGSNIHLKVVAEGKNITYIITDLATSQELWNHTLENGEFALGSFGFRLVTSHTDGSTNINTVGLDNLKVVAIGEVGDHLASGKTLAEYVPNVESEAIMPEITEAITVSVPEVVTVKAEDIDTTKTEYVFYENDFSDAATIADFTQYRGRFAIKDGKLYYAERTTGFEDDATFAFLIYSATDKDGYHVSNLLSDYVVEVDIYASDSQFGKTSSGVITRADLAQADSENSNSFYGYVSFISNDGLKGAVGYCNSSGAWGGNLNVGPADLDPLADYHLKVVHSDKMLTYTITSIETGEVVYEHMEPAIDWFSGSFGLRMRAANNTLINVGTEVAFDNLKVTALNKDAMLLNAGYYPNAVIEGLEEPEETTVALPDDKEPTETTAKDDKADSDVTTTTSAADAKEPAAESNNTMLIIGIVAAVILVAVIVVVVIKKKKN